MPKETIQKMTYKDYLVIILAMITMVSTSFGILTQFFYAKDDALVFNTVTSESFKVLKIETESLKRSTAKLTETIQSLEISIAKLEERLKIRSARLHNKPQPANSGSLYDALVMDKSSNIDLPILDGKVE